MRQTVARLLCIFPFEEAFFWKYGVSTTFIGHPLARIVKPSLTRAEFCEKFGLIRGPIVVVLLPGSRHGEVARHMPDLLDAGLARIPGRRPALACLGFAAPDLAWAQIFGNLRARRASK